MNARCSPVQALPQPTRTCSDSRLRRTHVCHEDLLALVRGQALTIEIDHVISKSDADEVATQLVRRVPGQRYRIEPSVGTVGRTFFDTNGDREERANYHGQAVDQDDNITPLLSGVANPLGRIRQDLETSSGRSLEVLRCDGAPMCWGVCRTYDPGSRLPPHQDALSMDAPNSQTALELGGQLSAVIGLQQADAGGELILWGQHYEPPAHQRELVHHGHAIDEAGLPEPMATLDMHPGQLVIFNSSYLHAVRTVHCGVRRTLSSFIGWIERTQHWAVWS